MPIDSPFEATLPIPVFTLPQRWFCLALAILIIGALFYLGAKPVAVGLFPEPLDKLAHFAVYSGITALLSLAMAGRLPLTVVALIAGIGALDEWHQASLPGRSADYLDLLTDIAAAGLTVFLLQLRRN